MEFMNYGLALLSFGMFLDSNEFIKWPYNKILYIIYKILRALLDTRTNGKYQSQCCEKD